MLLFRNEEIDAFSAVSASNFNTSFLFTEASFHCLDVSFEARGTSEMIFEAPVYWSDVFTW